MTSAKKERKFAGCPSEGGCSGYGVLEPSRGKGPPTATQQLASNMKGAQVDLSRATGNAMLGVGMHPYRLTKGDQRKPTTASSMFLQDMHANSTPPPSHGGRMAMDGAGKQVTQPGIASSVPIAPPPPVQAPPDPFGGGPDPIDEVEGAGAGANDASPKTAWHGGVRTRLEHLRSRKTRLQSPDPRVMADTEVFFTPLPKTTTDSNKTPDAKTEPLPKNRGLEMTPNVFTPRSLRRPKSLLMDNHLRLTGSRGKRSADRLEKGSFRAVDIFQPRNILNSHEK